MYTVTRLSREQLATYAGLTFPSLQEELLAESGRVQVVAAGASCFGKPVGLVWANYWPRHEYGRIRTMFVIGKYRRRGIGCSGSWNRLWSSRVAGRCLSNTGKIRIARSCGNGCSGGRAGSLFRIRIERLSSPPNDF